MVFGTIWVSVFDPERGRACVNALLKIRGETQAITGFQGDTLLVLDRVVDEDRQTNWLKRVVVQPARCDWRSVEASE
jgi:hypothetical protein